jgi:amidase
MSRYVEDLIFAMKLLAKPDGADFTSPPVPLFESLELRKLRVAFFKYNGFAPCERAVQDAVTRCARFLERIGLTVEEATPPGVENTYELELALLGADGTRGIEEFLREQGTREAHSFLTAFLDHMRPFETSASGLARRWAQWDEYRRNMQSFFSRYDVVLCPAYTQVALRHGESVHETNFRGFSYTMAWSVAGTPAATVRCDEQDGLPINIQVVAAPWRDLTALAVCQMIEHEFGGWKAPRSDQAAGTKSTSTGVGTSNF